MDHCTPSLSPDNRVTEEPGSHGHHSLSSSKSSILLQINQSLPKHCGDNAVVKTAGSNSKPSLRYRRKPIYLLAFYIPLLIVPWILTCILAVRPLGFPSYIKQNGTYTIEDTFYMVKWLRAIQVLNSIAGLVTVSIISALLAQAVIVYTQRRKAKQQLTVRQTFALADRGWSDLDILTQSLRDRIGPGRGRGASSGFLWSAAVLLLISSVPQPLQQILVSTPTIQIITCEDNPVNTCGIGRYYVVGSDPEPSFIAAIPINLAVQEVASSLALTAPADFQANLWSPAYDSATISQNPRQRGTLSWYFTDDTFGFLNTSIFASAIQNGTTTGVLRQHALRLNSSAYCESIPPSKFPSTCLGRRPFQTTYTKDMDIRVCAPGEYGATPWTPSRDRQDISEELYIDAIFHPFSSIEDIDIDVDDLEQNFTIHCVANTTRGYFELGNNFNDNTPGPLLNVWPDPDDLASNFNDDPTLTRLDNETVPEGIDWHAQIDPFDMKTLSAPGPLMTTVIALFGNQSFFYLAANVSGSTPPQPLAAICEQSNIPFARFDFMTIGAADAPALCWGAGVQKNRMKDARVELGRFMATWIFESFGDPQNAARALNMSLFLANRAVLTTVATVDGTGGYRPIVTSPGVGIEKPYMTRAGQIVISVLIFLQLGGIAILTWYIYQVPTWTPALDAMAIARIGSSLGKDGVGPIGPVSVKDMEQLAQMDGLIGVIEDVDREGHEQCLEPQLGLGASGVTHHGHASKKKDA